MLPWNIYSTTSHKSVMGSIINIPVLKGRELYRLKCKTKNYTEEGSARSQAQLQSVMLPVSLWGSALGHTELSKNVLSRKEWGN